MQTILVLITFLIAAGYLLKKFVWSPLTEKRRQTTTGTFDGGNTKCGKNDCGCH